MRKNSSSIEMASLLNAHRSNQRKIVVYYPDEDGGVARGHKDVLYTFYQGLSLSDHQVSFQPLHVVEDCDIAVVFGGIKKRGYRAGLRRAILERQRDQRKDYILIDKGYLYGNDPLQPERERYFSAGWNGLNGRADFVNESMPADRWRGLGLTLFPVREGGSHILVAAQVPNDASVREIDYLVWLESIVGDLIQRTDREIRVRPHPLAQDQIPLYPGTVRSTDTLQGDLEDAWGVVSFNSNVTVLAALQGIPVIVFDRGAMAYSIADDSFDNLENLSLVGREQWVYNLSYAQWNLEEFTTGKAWEHLERKFAVDDR